MDDGLGRVEIGLWHGKDGDDDDARVNLNGGKEMAWLGDKGGDMGAVVVTCCWCCWRQARSRARRAWRLFWNHICTVRGFMPSCLPSSVRSSVEGKYVWLNTWFNTASCEGDARLRLVLARERLVVFVVVAVVIAAVVILFSPSSIGESRFWILSTDDDACRRPSSWYAIVVVVVLLLSTIVYVLLLIDQSAPSYIDWLYKKGYRHHGDGWGFAKATSCFGFIVIPFSNKAGDVVCCLLAFRYIRISGRFSAHGLQLMCSYWQYPSCVFTFVLQLLIPYSRNLTSKGAWLCFMLWDWLTCHHIH